MPIQVTCPGCLSRFTVSDKYAGKKGPCPKCKKELTVPDKSQEVVIHAPESAGPKDSKGVAVLKPIKRTDFKLTTREIAISAAIAIVAVAFAIVGRVSFTEQPWWFLSLGAIAMSFPLAWAGYIFLHDDELGTYVGQELINRVAICAGVFAVTWGLYWLVSYYLGSKTLADVDGIQFAISVLVMFTAGALVSMAVFELEIGQAVMHYGLYFFVTFLLALIAGATLCEPLSNAKPKSQFDIPGLPPVQPAVPPTTSSSGNAAKESM